MQSPIHNSRANPSKNICVTLQPSTGSNLAIVETRSNANLLQEKLVAPLELFAACIDKESNT